MGWSNQVERNLQAIEYEKNGNVQKAIELYELNVEENFDGTHPYERLSELYLNAGQNDDLIRVLEKALKVFEGVHYSDCNHKHTQLERFKQMYENFTTVLESVN